MIGEPVTHFSAQNRTRICTPPKRKFIDVGATSRKRTLFQRNPCVDHNSGSTWINSCDKNKPTLLQYYPDPLSTAVRLLLHSLQTTSCHTQQTSSQSIFLFLRQQQQQQVAIDWKGWVKFHLDSSKPLCSKNLRPWRITMEVVLNETPRELGVRNRPTAWVTSTKVFLQLKTTKTKRPQQRPKNKKMSRQSRPSRHHLARFVLDKSTFACFKSFLVSIPIASRVHR